MLSVSAFFNTINAEVHVNITNMQYWLSCSWHACASKNFLLRTLILPLAASANLNPARHAIVNPCPNDLAVAREIVYHLDF